GVEDGACAPENDLAADADVSHGSKVGGPFGVLSGVVQAREGVRHAVRLPAVQRLHRLSERQTVAAPFGVGQAVMEQRQPIKLAVETIQPQMPLAGLVAEA